jgi:hypothetical protein
MTGVVLRILDDLPAIATDRFWKGDEFTLVLFSISGFPALASRSCTPGDRTATSDMFAAIVLVSFSSSDSPTFY